MNRIVVEMTPDERDFLLMAVRMVKHETEHPTVVSTLKSGQDMTDRWCEHHESPGSCPVYGCAHHSTDPSLEGV